MKTIRQLFAVACLLALVAPLWGNARAQQVNQPAQQTVSGPGGLFAIRNARIVTVSGPQIENGTIVVRNGRIEAVGANINVPAGAQEINAQGLTVYPGMIDLGTSMGLVEISLGAPGTVDIAETGPFNPNAQAINGINPHSAHIPVTRVNGVTSVLSMPQGGIISGQAAIINLDGTTAQEMAVVPTAALIINFPRVATFGGGFGFGPQQPPPITELIRTRDRQLDDIRRLLRDAEAYGRAVDAAERDRTLPRPEINTMLASLLPYIRGERPVIFRADREQEIRGALRFAEEMRLRPIIYGGDDAWRVASLLRERNVPVILNGIWSLPRSEDDPYDVLYENAAKLQQAGVRFAISSGDSGPNVRDLPYQAGMASAFGLPRDEALRAVTLYPAQIMGVGDRLGSIEPGKIANLVITDGDLLEARRHVRHLFINGRQIPLTSRHTELYEQFRNRR